MCCVAVACAACSARDDDNSMSISLTERRCLRRGWQAGLVDPALHLN